MLCKLVRSHILITLIMTSSIPKILNVWLIIQIKLHRCGIPSSWCNQLLHGFSCTATTSPYHFGKHVLTGPYLVLSAVQALIDMGFCLALEFPHSGTVISV